MVKSRTVIELRGGDNAGWWWQVRRVPPYGTVGEHVFRAGYAYTLLGAWWASHRAIPTDD